MDKNAIKAMWLCWFIYPILALAAVYLCIKFTSNIEASILVVFFVWFAITAATIVRLIYNDVKNELVN